MARVLVVDDDEDIRDLVSQSLENAGYDVAAAATGTEAWDALHAEHYDATVLDVCLPGLSGLDIARGLHDEHVLHPSDRTVVVMLSALSSSADACTTSPPTCAPSWPPGSRG